MDSGIKCAACDKPIDTGETCQFKINKKTGQHKYLHLWNCWPENQSTVNLQFEVVNEKSSK